MTAEARAGGTALESHAGLFLLLFYFFYLEWCLSIFGDSGGESCVVVSKTDMKRTVFHRNVSALISWHRWQCCGAANLVQLHLRAVVCNQCAIHALPRLL